MRRLATLVLLLGFTPGTVALATEVPTIAVGTSYAAARDMLQAAGWTPTPLSDDPKRCKRGFEEMCRAYAETAACSKAGRCAFFWRKGKSLLEVGTLGKGSPSIGHLRCRVGCS